jgi:peptide/nickel transport system permease protein
MGKLILKRLVTMIPLLLIMSFVTFAFLSLSPGNFVSSMRLNPSYSEETIRMIEKQYYLDQNLLVRYVLWLRDIVRLDFGYSFTFKRRVGDIIFSRVFYTLLLSFSSFLFTWLLAVPLGIVCAVYKNRLWDKIISFSAFATLSMPSFFLALLLLYAATATGALPAGGVTSSDFDSLSLWGKILDHLRHIIIPMLVIGISSMAGIIRITRGNVIEIMSKEYVTAARARGLSGFSIFYVHILKNALNPLITIFGYYISSLLSGAALTEIICSWPGLGSIMLQAVRSQDINLVMASMVIGGVMLIAGNLVADILLAMNDKRIIMQSA